MTFDEEVGLLLPQSTSEKTSKLCLSLDDAASLEAIFSISSADDSNNACSNENIYPSPLTTNCVKGEPALVSSVLSNTIPSLESITGGMACAPSIINDSTSVAIHSKCDAVDHKDPQFNTAMPVGKPSGSSIFQADRLYMTQSSKNPDRRAQQIAVQYTEKEKRERKYECEYCRKRFSRPSSLASHIYTHTGERPFACDFPGCSKRFSVQSNLRRHRKVHSNNHNRMSRKGCACGFQLSRPSFSEKPLSRRATQAAGPAELPSLNLLLATYMPDSGHLSGENARKIAPGLQHNYSHICSGIPAPPQLGYAPSVRTTATTEYQPFNLAAADNVVNPVNSCRSNELPLLADMENSVAMPPQCSVSMSLGAISSVAESAQPPKSSQSLCLTNSGLAGAHSDDAYLTQQATSGFNISITTTQIDSILSNVGTAYCGDSDSSSSSSSDNPIASGDWPLSLDGCRNQTTGLCPTNVPDRLNVSAPCLGKGISDKASTNVDLFANVPMIAAPTMMTDSSITTKALDSAINPQCRSASEDIETLLLGAQAKQTPFDFACLAHSKDADISNNVHARSTVEDNEATTKALLDNLYSYLENA